MALRRLQPDEVYRWYLASPLAFEDWENPTLDELNANPTNDPSALIWNLTCALNQDDSQFDLDEPETDETLTFCQSAGNSEVTSRSATVIYSIVASEERWTDAASTDAAEGFNTSTLAQSLLMWRGIEYFAILSVGKDPEAPFEAGDRIKMAEIATDWAVPTIGTGETVRWIQTTASRSRINWNYELTAS